MNPRKKVRPAAAESVNGPRDIEQLGSGLDQSNTLKPDQPQAPPLLADTAGQSDYDFFVAHPGIDSRVRLPFADEIAPELFEQGSRRAFIHVFIIRNSDGSPGTRARAVFYSEGGTA